MLWSYLTAFVPFIVNTVLKIFYQETESESHLRRQIADLKLELAGVSMGDEFAKYAKINRKMNKIKDELINQNQLRCTLRIKVKLCTSAALYLLSGFIVMYLMWQYGREQILHLPPEWLYPLDSFILSNKNGTVGLSMTCWLIICGTVAKVVSASVT